MGSRGSSSGRSKTTNIIASGDYKKTSEYRDAYYDELQVRFEEAAVPAALPSSDNNDLSNIEVQMRGYASAIGDPIKAMQNQRKIIASAYEDYKEATRIDNMGTRDALERTLNEYDEAIKRMKRVKKDSKRPDLLE